MVQCPYPGCLHVGTFITKMHCESEHKMDRKDLVNKYGHPKRAPDVPNNIRKWIMEQTPQIHSASFEGAEYAAGRLKKRKQ